MRFLMILIIVVPLRTTVKIHSSVGPIEINRFTQSTLGSSPNIVIHTGAGTFRLAPTCGRSVHFYANSMIECRLEWRPSQIYGMFVLNVTIRHWFCTRNTVSNVNTIDNDDISVTKTIFEEIP